MKILLVAPRFHTNLYYTVLALQSKGHNVKIAVLYKGKSEFYENIDLIQFPLAKFSVLLTKIFSIFKKNQLKSDFELRIEAPNKNFKPFYKNFAPEVILLKAFQNLLALRILLVAYNTSSHVFMLTQTKNNHIWGSVFLFKLNMRLFKFLGVKAYITPIKVNEDIFKQIGITNTYYVPFTINEPVKKGKNQNSKQINVISVGKFVERKNQIMLCASVHELLTKKYKISLTIYGEIAQNDYYQKTIKYITENKLENYITLRNHLPYKKMLQEYSKYDIFVLPAYDEPAAYSPVEALNAGIPIICSNDNGTSCYIEEGKNGYTFERKKLKSLTEKLELIINHPEGFSFFSENALNSVKLNHSNEQFLSVFEKILQEQTDN